jgi:hypothetical protein
MSTTGTVAAATPPGLLEHKPPTDAAAVREIKSELHHVHERAMGTQQLDILRQQDSVLAILDNFASKDMPGRQQEIQQTVNQILAAVGGVVAPGSVPPPAPAT